MGFFLQFRPRMRMVGFDFRTPSLWESGQLSPYPAIRALQCGVLASILFPLEQHRHGETFPQRRCRWTYRDLIFEKVNARLPPHRILGGNNMEMSA